MDRNEFRNRFKQYKKAREESPGLKYYDFMERLAEFKAKEWDDDPDMVLTHMLNDNSYNYRQMYEDDPNYNIEEGHFVDTYKTVHHPTFSEESMYSGKKSQYNPEGIVGGSWDESTKSFYLNDKRQSKRKAQDYLNHADPGYRAIPKYDEGGEVENNFLKQFGNQIFYKPQETSWWSDVKNWWNNLTDMKNYAYGNCAVTPDGKHTTQCAHYSNAVLRNQGYKNIVGDAWTRAAHSGMKKITSGYDGLTKPEKWNEDDAHEYLQAAAENFTNKVDTTSLNSYDVIGLYYPDSPNTKKAFEQGKWGETQTHTGHIAIGRDGTHYVVHNVDGHLKMNKLADMLTGDYEYLPVSAYRPRK